MELNSQWIKANEDKYRLMELMGKFDEGLTDAEKSEIAELKKHISMKDILRTDKLHNYIKHDALYSAYPDLKEIPVRLTALKDGAGYDVINNIMVMSAKALKSTQKTKRHFIHEMQHAVQVRENFAQGANEEYWKDYLQELGYDEEGLAGKLYYLTAGEIEARDTAGRLDYSAEQRKNIRPDIDNEYVVFVDKERFGKSTNNNAESLDKRVVLSDNDTLIPLDKRFDFSETDIRYSIKDVDRYTEREYNDYGWVAVNEVLTGNELTKLYSQFADIQENGFKYPISSANEYMILVGDKYDAYEHLVYIKGDIKHPIITQVIGVYSEFYYHKKNVLEEVTILNEKGNRNPIRFIEDYAGEELFFRITLQDYPSYNELQRERFSSGSNKNSRGKQNGRRSFTEDSEPKVKLSLKETAEASENRENLIKANDNLRVANALLKKELKLTQGKMVSYDTAKDIAKYLTSEYSSQYDTTRLSREIYNIFNWHDKVICINKRYTIC